MVGKNRYLSSILTCGFFLIIFISKLFVDSTQSNADLWYHIKAGQVILKQGILHQYPFSQYPRLWYPSEWLFQIGLYLYTHLFGLGSLNFLLACLTVVHMVIFFFFLRKIFNLNTFWNCFILFFYFAFLFGTFDLRPQIIAYTFFLITFFLILWYLQKGKNYLWITPITTFIWTNLHGSVIFAVYLYIAYTFLCIILTFYTKEKQYVKRSTILFIYTVVISLITISPPLFFSQYQYDFFLFQHRWINQQLIQEWTPVINNQLGFILYTGSVASVVGITIYVLLYQKILKKIIFLAPLLFFIAFGYTAERNLYFGYTAILLILSLDISFLQLTHLKKYVKLSIFGFLSLFLIYCLLMILQNYIPAKSYYPYQAAQFIKTEHMQGNMFNEYEYGSYLLYALYPEQKVFVDGRSEVYDCCELPTIYTLLKDRYQPMDKYKTLLNGIWKRYTISFVVIKTNSQTYTRRIADILSNDPSWNLVYWDDTTQIFVKRDGKNTSLLQKFGTVAATPYQDTPFKKDMSGQALIEYTRMEKITDSARSRNALGLLYFQQGKQAQAEHDFEKANQLDPTFDSPYMNLAELNIMQTNDYTKAIQLYQKATEVNNNRAYTFIRLGQLYLHVNDKADAVEIWQKGQILFSDQTVKNAFQHLIQEVQ